MGRFTNPRDLYFGEGARHEVKNLKGSKAIIVTGGGSMRRGGFLQDVEADLLKFLEAASEGKSLDFGLSVYDLGAEPARAWKRRRRMWCWSSAMLARCRK